MTAIVYLGEILVASLLAIVLLAISQLRMNSDAVLFVGGVVALTLAEYAVHRFVLHGFAPIEHRLHHANPDCAVQTVCRCHFLSIIKAITDLRPETTASAPHFGTMSSGRCCDDDVGAVASI